MALGVHACARLSVDQAVDRQTAVDRLHDPNSRVLPVDRMLIFLFYNNRRSTGRSTGANGSFGNVAYRSTGSCPESPNGYILESVSFFNDSTDISCFLVAKLTPNDLVSIMNGIYSFPINRGHWSLVLHKKDSQASSVFKRRSISLLFIFKVLSTAKVFTWFSSLLSLYY